MKTRNSLLRGSSGSAGSAAVMPGLPVAEDEPGLSSAGGLLRKSSKDSQGTSSSSGLSQSFSPGASGGRQSLPSLLLEGPGLVLLLWLLWLLLEGPALLLVLWLLLLLWLLLEGSVLLLLLWLLLEGSALLLWLLLEEPLLLMLLWLLSLLLLIAGRGRLQLFSGCVPPVLDDSSQHA